ncbi:hypothetical protein HID58_020403 [Brassica napus]|uniref:Uncharacterized protein n=2 Tax=Brassica napus TaxID=3708 RepID=A0ABQ7XH00_BRANA|nr:hypothetical protein HID58_020403 [Brassica napus]
MLKQDSKRQSTSTPASFRRLEEQESRYSTEQGSDKLVTEDIETYTPERASPQDPRRIKLQNEDTRHTLKLAESKLSNRRSDLDLDLNDTEKACDTYEKMRGGRVAAESCYNGLVRDTWRPWSGAAIIRLETEYKLS